MKKLGMLGIIGGAALLTAAPLSLQWSQKNVTRLPINLRSRTTEFPPTSGNQRPCRDAGVGAIAPAFAMLERAERASHIDPPASSNAIMQRASPYCGENPGPGKDVHGRA